jgi:hypothetical protein
MGPSTRCRLYEGARDEEDGKRMEGRRRGAGASSAFAVVLQRLLSGLQALVRAQVNGELEITGRST